MSHFSVPQMSKEQIYSCVDLLLENHPDWSIEDFTVFSKSVRLGNIHGLEYPKSFNRIDPDMIIQFASVYNQAKAETRDRLHTNEKNQRNYIEKKELEEVKKKNIPSLQPFITQLEKNIKEEKQNYHGSGYPEKMREQFSTDEQVEVEIMNEEKSVTRMVERTIADYGIEDVKAEWKSYLKVKGIVNIDSAPEWIQKLNQRVINLGNNIQSHPD